MIFSNRCIVIEGPDGSGKSTLANEIKERYGYAIISSGGPSKSTDEITLRTRRLIGLQKVSTSIIFDRHPLISHPIYSKWGHEILEYKELLKVFLDPSIRPVFIFCQGKMSHLRDQVLKDYDTKEHLSYVTKEYERILKDYERLSLKYADIIYRKGESTIFGGIEK